MHRVIAISDLHIGGEPPPMLGHPETLAGFLTAVAEHPTREGESLELVIHGDFVDFLAEEPWRPWTPSEDEAITKLRKIFGRVPEVRMALCRCLQRVNRFTLLLGNHDVELALPRVREELFRLLETAPQRCNFVYNNEAYRVGDLLIEHGNRYDVWNRIDHDGLRQTLSALSRGEKPGEDWLVSCPGSNLVVKAMNPLKEMYSFIDLIKPEDKLIAILLPQIAPKSTQLIPHFFTYERNSVDRFIQRVLPRAPGRQFIADEDGSPTSHLPTDVALGERDALIAYAEESKLLDADDAPPAVKLEKIAGDQFPTDGPLAAKEVKKLQTKLRHALRNDQTFKEDDQGAPGTASRACFDAAKKIIDSGTARVVVMGHTHLRRNIAVGDGRYINTGTWADLIRVEDKALEDSPEGRIALNNWWRRLVSGEAALRFHEPTFADVRLNDDNHIIAEGRPFLRIFKNGSIDE
ncbi:MAG: metallophosphoesterase [Myxococcales bacterium]|jgi:UDP-2,3-diacylglucosamine pyrophosphatase LpxH|nr:metallophosphoesterase [Myxococcales bacterium]